MPVYTIKLFGPQAETVGRDRVEVRTHGDAAVTEADLRQLLGDQHPALAASMGVSRVASDHQYVTADTPLDPDAELALIGLVSGG